MPLRTALRWLLAAIYIGFGALHLLKAHSFLPIMPPWVPQPLLVVLATGACEIAGGAGLMIPSLRKAAGIGLALYAVGVFPANLYHAFSGVQVPGLPSSWWYHAPRLAFQPVFVWWALYAAGIEPRARRF
jgi:uncharacterized membrane protein